MSEEITVPEVLTPHIEVDTNKETEPTLHMNAWSVQNIVYELVTNYMIANPPETMGFPHLPKYDKDKTKSEILIDIAYNWDAAVAGKRPAIFIQRDDWDMKHPTMGQSIDQSNSKESEDVRMSINIVPIVIKVIASPIGYAEMLAEYVRQAFIYYQKEIQRDFRFRRFRIVEVSAPKIYVEAKENFVIMISIDVAFDEGWIVKGDHLKLKTVGKTIFEGVAATCSCRQ